MAEEENKEEHTVESKEEKIEQVRKVLQQRADEISGKVRELEDAMVVSQDTLKLEFQI